MTSVLSQRQRRKEGQSSGRMASEWEVATCGLGGLGDGSYKDAGRSSSPPWLPRGIRKALFSLAFLPWWWGQHSKPRSLPGGHWPTLDILSWSEGGSGWEAGPNWVSETSLHLFTLGPEMGTRWGRGVVKIPHFLSR